MNEQMWIIFDQGCSTGSSGYANTGLTQIFCMQTNQRYGFSRVPKLQPRKLDHSTAEPKRGAAAAVFQRTYSLLSGGT